MYTVRIFMKCTHVCAAQQLIDFSRNYKENRISEIAEPSPDIHIKVTALTESKKLLYIHRAWSALPIQA